MCRCWVYGAGSQLNELQAFDRCRKDFLELYQITQQFQAVENSEGGAYFDRRSSNASSKLR